MEYQKILLEKMIEEKHDFSVPICMPVRHCNYSMAKTLFDIYLQVEKKPKGDSRDLMDDIKNGKELPPLPKKRMGVRGE